MELSAPEQRLLNFASERFGEALGQFMLAGLWEEKVAQRWKFSITYDNDEGVKLKRQVDILSHEPADGSSCLPRSKDPLILLALLRLLIRSNQIPPDSLLYEQADLLNLLGWADTQSAHDVIDEAVKRYSLMLFRWKMNRTELARNNLSHYRAMGRLISEFETVDEDEEGQTRRALNRVIFNSNFIERLCSRSLFEIDWNRVISVTRVPPS